MDSLLSMSKTSSDFVTILRKNSASAMLSSGTGKQMDIQQAIANRFKEDFAASVIQRSWQSYRDKRLFCLLKHTVRAAEHCLTYEILRKISPLEAELIKDPSMQCRVRFRFLGHEFPPVIVFKIYQHNEGHGSKYISGKRIISPASEAASDACKLMGHRRFYDQLILDELHRQQIKIADEYDIATMKDYKQYASSLDETPAYLGGKDNFWRKLSLESLPKTTMIYDIADYAHSRMLSERLKENLPLLLVKPKTEEIRLKQLKALTERRITLPPSPSTTALARLSHRSATSGKSARRSQQALQKVAKMRRIFGLQKEEQNETDTYRSSHNEHHRLTCSVASQEKQDANDLSEEEWEQEANKLYAWTQELPIEETKTYSPVNEVSRPVHIDCEKYKLPLH
ncbi:putative uncharacterized protein CXorf58 homolog [Protopterus annectens]|uniref:putative uncharacterized protein CXorf58 homolog n=1 Tax=Protopterus annectens TaxID=7888 RepID=UPI001CFA371C|nr:putative uncharacterized protein CXorf58 homolog [Protopterus annectens]